MAKKEKKEKGFMESVHDGYIRGSMEERRRLRRQEQSPHRNHYRMKLRNSVNYIYWFQSV